MPRSLPKTDVVIVGMGAAGGVAALPLTNAGLKVVGLEAGGWLNPRDFAPDELRNNNRNWPQTIQKAASEAPTVRVNPSETAVQGGHPMMNAVGGTSMHYWAQSWRLNPWDFKVVSSTLARYGRGRVPEDSTVEDWPISYEDLEPFYDKVEYTVGVSGRAGNVQGVINSAGNMFEGQRRREYPMQPLRSSPFTDLMSSAATKMEWHPFQGPAAITTEGLSIGGDPVISKKSNGELHIGKNSWITKEENGRQKVYAKDSAGNPIPIDYTNGTKLLINGRDVEQSINNVGALSAALTGLPTVPTDTTLACGLGTGTHGGDFAFSGGCASKVNEKLSINYAASMSMPGQDYAGDFEDTFSARAGFVWKLGKSVKPSLISMKAKEKMEDKINSLEEKNEKILSKNQKLENTVSTLLARLERLEKVALGKSKSQDLATIKLP